MLVEMFFNDETFGLGGVYVPHTMYLPVHGTPPGATLNGLAPNTTAIATSANGMLATTHYYTPFTTAVLTGTLSAAGSTIPSSAFFPSGERYCFVY